MLSENAEKLSTPYLNMKSITTEQAQKNLGKLLNDASFLHEPIQIVGEPVNGILISETDWYSIQETLYLLSIPGMRESIQEGLKTSLKDCVKELDW